MVVAVDANLVAVLGEHPEMTGKGSSDLPRRKERAGERCPDAIHSDGVGAEHLLQEATSGEEPQDGLP